MKLIDFTQPGGLPMTQELLAFMQNSMKEMFKVLAQLGKTTELAPNTAMTILGMAALGGGNISEGYFLYNGEIIYFPAQASDRGEAGYTLYLVIDTAIDIHSNPLARVTISQMGEGVNLI